jgi:AcrR family transcriptional regulator
VRTEDQVPQQRLDARRTRSLLLDAAGDLLAECGQTFGLPDLARRAGVATPTAYRHFTDVAELVEAYQGRLISELCEALRRTPVAKTATDGVLDICRVWVREAERWGAAALRVRPSEGVAERIRGGNARTVELFDALMPTVRRLLAGGDIPEQSPEYVVLMWVTIMDERLIMELRHTFQWPAAIVVDQLAAALLGILRAPGEEQRRWPWPSIA